MDFNKALYNVDSTFESILEIMKLRKSSEEIDSARNLLLTVNLIIDYFLNREDDQLKIPVVYFPVCEAYSQRLCEDFVCLKFGFFADQNRKSFLSRTLKKDSVYIPSDIKTKKQRDLLIDNHRYEQKLSSILARTIIEYHCNGVTMLYCDNIKEDLKEFEEAQKSWNRKTVNKYWYLAHAVTNYSKSAISSHPLVLVPEDCDEFYNLFIDPENNMKIENIIVFPSKTADGRYSEFCSEILQKPYLDDFVNAETGLRNVFFFCFSRKPYRLRRLFDFKQRMKERTQIYEDDNTLDFISFTYEESLQLNGKQDHKHLNLFLGKEEDDIQVDYENILDDITMGLERYVSRRNEMSLCISNDACDYYNKKLAEETEADESLLSEILTLNSNLWADSVDIILRHFVYQDDIFVVTGNDIALEIKYMFKDLLTNVYNANSVTFGGFGDLRAYQIKGNYQNEIRQSKIIVVSFRNDYTESIFHKYPNSFDPFCINPDQKLIMISNYFLMRQYYEWGKYNYGRSIRKILKSEFRSSEMKPVLVEYKRPSRKLPEDTREEELDRNSNRSTVQQIHVTLKDGTVHDFGRSEWMLYDYKKSKGVAPLSDLYDLYESFDELRIQPLSPLVRLVVKNFIDSERDKDTRSERMFKEQPSYGLTPAEISSDMQLWKILLAKRVQQSSERKVYDEIMSHFNERYIISFYSFKRWIDPNYGIPRARKMQKYLIEDYLGIRPPYINLIRRIKERTKSDTESITISIRHFLNIALLSDDYKNVYHAISEQTKDLLDISSVDDVINIISSIKKRINFKSVKMIEQ